ncbi:hypothetical protein NUW54_g2808 [Trametes sanguinea]|uniref:Uncharacterized protein n=1 Tax=Trametes sanguinea TaxID=158606 RepID=A0ACC1Q698_9APHY|nr:hypothetical protein NUW54_g2808 [Trametes sanguinea]
MFEAQITGTTAQVSQSAQWAPFNHGYIWQNTSEYEIIADPSISYQNTFIGSVTQQATSVVTETDPLCYEYDAGCFSIYGFEYKPGFEDGYITWVSNNKVSWTLLGPGMGPDPLVEIQERPVPPEPMYIIMNLGMSYNFGPVDLDHLPFPVHMRVDYIRVYQPSNAITYTAVLTAINRGDWLERSVVEEYSKRMWETMQSRDIQPNRVTYNVLLKASLENQEPEGLGHMVYPAEGADGPEGVGHGEGGDGGHARVQDEQDHGLATDVVE